MPTRDRGRKGALRGTVCWMDQMGRRRMGDETPTAHAALTNNLHVNSQLTAPKPIKPITNTFATDCAEATITEAMAFVIVEYVVSKHFCRWHGQPTIAAYCFCSLAPGTGKSKGYNETDSKRLEGASEKGVADANKLSSRFSREPTRVLRIIILLLNHYE